ncbi:MAG: BMP family protein [Armatimonadetes bacterium]|nr:BMP family protein [Armatimonadota bacterium]
MTRRRLLLLPLLVCLPLALAGCGDNKTGTNPATPSGGAPASSGFKAALLTTGPVTDGGWNQSAYAGLQKIEQDLGAQGDKQESLKPDQFAGAFRDFASRGYNIIFAHGDEFGPDAAKAAKQFPKTVFITTGGEEKAGPNVAPILFATEEGTYLQGMEAALVSKSGKGGFVGGQELPPVKRAAEAFAAGARAINPKFQFTPIYLNSWTDTSAAKAATDSLLGSGADVIAHNCDAAAAGMFQAADGKPGVYTFGVNADENGKAGNVLSSALLDIPKAFDEIAKSVKDGSFKGQPLALGLKSGDVRLVDNPKLASVIPAAGRARVQQAEQQIAAGTLKVTGS